LSPVNQLKIVELVNFVHQRLIVELVPDPAKQAHPAKQAFVHQRLIIC